MRRLRMSSTTPRMYPIDKPDHDTDHGAEDGRSRSDDHDLAGPEDDTAEHVSAESVSTQQVAFLQWPDPFAERILLGRVVRRR